jgi:hypothetical protein
MSSEPDSTPSRTARASLLAVRPQHGCHKLEQPLGAHLEFVVDAGHAATEVGEDPAVAAVEHFAQRHDDDSRIGLELAQLVGDLPEALYPIWNLVPSAISPGVSFFAQGLRGLHSGNSSR